jgi:hypothetical protein
MNDEYLETLPKLVAAIEGGIGDIENQMEQMALCDGELKNAYKLILDNKVFKIMAMIGDWTRITASHFAKIDEKIKEIQTLSKEELESPH